MNRSVRGADSDNVTLTLEERKSMADALAGRQSLVSSAGRAWKFAFPGS